MDAISKLQQQVAELSGTPLVENPCLRRWCNGSTVGPSLLCHWCGRHWVEEDARRENIGHRLGYSNGVWPCLDQFGEPLDALEELTDDQLRCLAKQKGIPIPNDPVRKAEREERYADEASAAEERHEQRVIERLKAQHARIAEKLGRIK